MTVKELEVTRVITVLDVDDNGFGHEFLFCQKTGNGTTKN